MRQPCCFFGYKPTTPALLPSQPAGGWLQAQPNVTLLLLHKSLYLLASLTRFHDSLVVDGFKYEVSVERRSTRALCVTLNDSSVEVLTRHMADAGFLMQVCMHAQFLHSWTSLGRLLQQGQSLNSWPTTYLQGAGAGAAPLHMLTQVRKVLLA